MGLYNFAQASLKPDAIQTTYDAVQADLLAILKEGGPAALNAKAEWRYKAAALVVENVISKFRMTDPTPMWTERRDLNNGDTYRFDRLINTLKVVDYAPLSEPLVFTPRKGSYPVRTSPRELAYGIELQKIINGQFSISDFGQMASEAISRHYIDLTTSAINIACAAGQNDQFGRALRYTDSQQVVQATTINSALKALYSTGQTNLTIFGTRFALDPLFDYGAQLAGFVTKEDLNNRGLISKYRGANLVQLTQEFNLFYQQMQPVKGANGVTVPLDKLIFITGDQPGSVLLERNLAALTWEEMDTREGTWSTGVRMDHGIFVHSPWNYRVVQTAP